MKTIRVLSMMLLSVVLLTLTSVPPALAEGTRFLGGTVRGEDGQPVSGALVAVYEAHGGDWIDSVLTGGAGDYLTTLPQGAYDVRAGANGYVEGTYPSNPLVVDGTTDLREVDITLQRALTISGSVLDLSGEPVAWAHVYVYSLDGQLVARVGTNELGEFEAQGLAAGDYKVEARDPSMAHLPAFYDDQRGLFEAANAVPAGMSGMILALPAAGTGTISGQLSGHVPAGVATFARAVAADGYIARTVEVDPSSGGFLIDRLPEGDYKVRAWSTAADVSYHVAGASSATAKSARVASEAEATIIHVADGQNVTGADIELAQGTGTIAGVVRDAAGYELAGAQIRVYDLEGRRVGASTSGEDGSFEAGRLPAGSYKVRVADVTGQFRTMYHHRVRGGVSSISQATPVALAQGGVYYARPINLPAREGGLSGAVIDAGNNPLQGIGVTIHDAQGSAVVTLTTNAAGVYSSGTLATGEYRVSAQDPRGLFEPGWAESTVTVLQGQSANADITMAAKAPARVATRASITPSRWRVRRGKLVTIAGALASAHPGAVVRVVGRDAYGRRFSLKRVTDENGRVRATVRVMRDMWYRVVYSGDAEHLGSASRNVHVRIATP